MHTRIGWMLGTPVLVACLSWGIAPSTASGQSYAEMVRMNDCISNMNARTDALSHQQWALLLICA